MAKKTISDMRLKRIKKEISYKTLVLFVACCMDEFDWGEEEVENFAIRWDRYYNAVAEHIISIKKVESIVKRVTGMTFEETGGFK